MGHVQSTRGFAPGAVRLSVLALLMSLGVAGCAQVAPSAKTIPTPTPSVNSATPTSRRRPLRRQPRDAVRTTRRQDQEAVQGLSEADGVQVERPLRHLGSEELKKYGFYPRTPPSTSACWRECAVELPAVTRPGRHRDDHRRDLAALALNTPRSPRCCRPNAPMAPTRSSSASTRPSADCSGSRTAR